MPSIIIAFLEYAVRHRLERSSGRFGQYATILLTAIALLSPGYSSVLCIAPGGHISIEELNAACCADSHISSAFEGRPENGYAAAGECRNCTDLLLSNDLGAITGSSRNAVSDTPGEAFGNHGSAIESFGAFRESASARVMLTVPISPSVPLRC